MRYASRIFGSLLLAALALLFDSGIARAQRSYSSPPPHNRGYGLYGPYVTRPVIVSPNVYYGGSGILYGNAVPYGTFATRGLDPFIYQGYGYPGYSYPGATGYLDRFPVELYGPGSSYTIPRVPTYLYSGNYVTWPWYAPYQPPPFLSAADLGQPAQTPQSRPARIRVKVPQANATLWFGQTQTKQTGLVRDFVTPPLEPEKKFKYSIRAIWSENGTQVERQRTVQIQAGQQLEVDFTQPEPQKKPESTSGKQ